MFFDELLNQFNETKINMKFKLKKKLTALLVLMFVSTFIVSQTAQQAKVFVNRSMMAVYKVQKEILKQNVITIDPAFKKSVKYQAVAVKLYKQNKLSDAIGYAYKARVQALELLKTLDPNSITNLDFNDDEKSISDASKYVNFNITQSLLTADESKKIDDLVSSDHKEFRKLELSIPIE